MQARPALTLALALAGLAAALWILRRLTREIGRRLDRLDGFQANNPRLELTLRHIDAFLVVAALLVAPLVTAHLLGAPPAVVAWFGLALRIALMIGAGLIVIRSAALLVDLIIAAARRAAARFGFGAQADRLGALAPTLQRCLAWALRVGLLTMVALELPRVRDLAWVGPRLIGAIGLVFAGRAALEIGRFEIDRWMLGAEGLSENDRRRRETLAPLVSSAWTYAAWFGTLVLALHALGFDVMPFIAGAGILGLVVGFGAQSLINDVVSGFFILFEHIYLVGDLVESGNARGVVEAIEFRTTKIRDTEGRLHILRNGDMKTVINYSRDYGVAVVAVDVSYDADLDRVLRSVSEAAASLRGRHPDVLADTEIEGIVAFGADALTIRTRTRVRAGRHEAVAAAMRLMLKQAFDREAGGRPRSRLVPAIQPAQKAMGA